ncbi:MAG: hypothetical protein HYT97_06570, partial [Elusimicrobia bacterium]|nr:hypothetical protein [Elusimicrobiota bacterium]
MLGYLDIGFTSNSGSERNYTLRWAEDRWHKYATLSLAIMENWSLDHKGLMELGKRVANDIRLGDFKDYVYVRDLVDGMFDSESMIPTNPLGLFGEFLRELYQNVKEGKNGVGDYAKALNDIFNLIKRNQEFYMQYKELMEKALVLLNKQGKSWKEIGLHKIIPIPTDQDSLKPLIELIEKLEKGNDNRQGIIKVVGTILVVISSVLAGQEVLANGLVPAITNGLSFIDLVPLITGGAGFQAQILGDSELVKGLFSFYQKVMGKIEDPGIRFLANIKDLKENPSKLNELKSFAEEAARVALSQDSSGEGVASTNDPSPFDLTQGKQDSLAEGTRPYEFVIVTDENKLLSKEEVIAFLKEYQV